MDVDVVVEVDLEFDLELSFSLHHGGCFNSINDDIGSGNVES